MGRSESALKRKNSGHAEEILRMGSRNRKRVHHDKRKLQIMIVRGFMLIYT
jgi:hypothetical protein